MKKTVLIWMVLVATLILAVPVLAQNEGIMDDPVTAIGLRPFRMESNYMSVAGYLRWQTFLETGIWISREQALEMAEGK